MVKRTLPPNLCSLVFICGFLFFHFFSSKLIRKSDSDLVLSVFTGRNVRGAQRQPIGQARREFLDQLITYTKTHANPVILFRGPTAKSKPLRPFFVGTIGIE